MKKKSAKKRAVKKTAKPELPRVVEPQVAVLGKEHNLSGFADNESGQYACEYLKYDAGRKCLVATDGTIVAAVPLAAGSNDMLIEARAVSQAIKESTKRKPSSIKNADGKVTVESEAGRTVRDAGTQDGKWPSWVTVFSVDISKATVACLCPKRLKKLADYAIACGEEDIRFAMPLSDHNVVQSGIVWQIGETVGVLMPRCNTKDPEELSEQLRAKIQAPLKALKLGK